MTKLIPFNWLPAAWGLKGRTYEEAKANYYLEGEELVRALIDIREDDPTKRRIAHLSLDYTSGKIDLYEFDLKKLQINGGGEDQRELLKIELAHGKINNYDHDIKRAELDFAAGTDLDIAKADIDLAYDKITKREYEKQVATLKKEPWVGIVSEGYDPKLGVNGWYCEFDWNEFWIEYLRLNGYVGLNDDEIHQAWFQDICRSVASEGEEQQEGAEIVPFSGRLVNHLPR
jgi:hypothetical protein